MNIIITSPSLSTNQNISGISTITNFIINNNKKNTYYHFKLGKKDDEVRNLYWFLRILKAYLKWIYMISTNKKNLIHFNFALSKPSILRDSPLILITRLLNRRIIIHLHGGEFLMHKNIPIWMGLLLRVVFYGEIRIIVQSDLERDVLKSKFNVFNISVLPNCIDLKYASEFSRKFLKKDDIIILFMGRISVAKGIEYIFESFKYLRVKNIKFRFFLAGKGPDEKLYIHKFKQLLGKDFEYKGVVSDGPKFELLKSSDIFLLPSFFEALPMALIESMSFGVVPVTTDVGSIKYLVKNEVNGLIIKKKSCIEIANAIESLFQNREYMQKLSSKAKQTIFDTYNPKVYISKLNEIYNYE